MGKWREELAENKEKVYDADRYTRPKPWRKKCEFFKEDVVGKIHIVLSNGIYIDTLNLMPRIQNQIRSLAAFDNPEFYKNKRLGYSNYNNFSAANSCCVRKSPLKSTRIGWPISLSSETSIGMPAFSHSSIIFSLNPLGICIYPSISFPK